MVKTGKTYIYLLFIILLGSTVYADITVQLLAQNPTLYRGEYLNFEVRVSGDYKNIQERSKVSVPDGFKLTPGESTSSSTSIVNSSVTYSKSFRYSAAALKEGKFNIGPFKVKVDGKEYQTNILEVNVVKQGSSTNSNDNNIIFFQSVPKEEYYVGEEIKHKVVLAFRNGTRVRDLNLSPASAFKQFITGKQDEKQYTKNLKGSIYQIVEVTTPIIAINPGEYVLDDVSLGYSQLEKSNRRNSLFDDDFFSSSFDSMFFGNYKKRSVILDSVKIKIKPLPKSPEGFSGAVGEFVISAPLKNKKFKQGEPFSLVVKISGHGNISGIEKPAFEETDDYGVSFSGEKKNLNNNGDFSGEKNFEFIVIPETEGEIKIKPIKFTYFSIKDKKYITVQTKEHIINVQKNSDFVKKEKIINDFSGNGQSVNSINMKKGVKIDSDIAYLSTDQGKNPVLCSSLNIFRFINIVLLLLIVLKVIYKFINPFIISSKMREYNKLKNILNKSVKNGTFYTDFSNFYWKYFGKILDIEPAFCVAEKIIERLNTLYPNSKEKIDELAKLSEKINMVSFAGVSSDMKEDFEKSIRLLEYFNKIKG